MKIGVLLVKLVLYFCRNEPVMKRMHRVVMERGGYLALYRGILPGTMRSFLSNGTSMVVMVQAQKKVSEWGLRGK